MAEDWITKWKNRQLIINHQIERYIEVYRRWFKIKYPDGVQIGTYDGGNDSGDVEINIEIPKKDIFRNIIYDRLLGEYGGFTGDFYCYGEIWYTKEGNFEAEGSESVTEWISYNETL